MPSLSYVNDKSFIDFVIERGSIPFVVRGNLECNNNFDFGAFGIKVSPPTTNLRVYAEDKDGKTLETYYIEELHQEAIFPGEITLHEKTRKGVWQALGILEFWADFMCLMMGNPRLIIEIQRPIQAIVSIGRPQLEFNRLEREQKLIIHYMNLDNETKDVVERALWWYRKGCNTFTHSLFDGYTAYWNTLEVLCGVGTAKMHKGENVEQQIHDYLRDKIAIDKDGKPVLKITAGHIQQCFNQFVNQSIPQQMKIGLANIMDEKYTQQVIYQCFEVKPIDEQLYKIRNDINHGNIKENSDEHRAKVYRRGMLLWHIIFRLLNKRLGNSITLGKQDDLDVLAKDINEPFFPKRADSTTNKKDDSET